MKEIIYTAIPSHGGKHDDAYAASDEDVASFLYMYSPTGAADSSRPSSHDDGGSSTRYQKKFPLHALHNKSRFMALVLIVAVVAAAAILGTVFLPSSHSNSNSSSTNTSTSSSPNTLTYLNEDTDYSLSTTNSSTTKDVITSQEEHSLGASSLHDKESLFPDDNHDDDDDEEEDSILQIESIKSGVVQVHGTSGKHHKCSKSGKSHKCSKSGKSHKHSKSSKSKSHKSSKSSKSKSHKHSKSTSKSKSHKHSKSSKSKSHKHSKSTSKSKSHKSSKSSSKSKSHKSSKSSKSKSKSKSHKHGKSHKGHKHSKSSKIVYSDYYSLDPNESYSNVFQKEVNTEDMQDTESTIVGNPLQSQNEDLKSNKEGSIEVPSNLDEHVHDGDTDDDADGEEEESHDQQQQEDAEKDTGFIDMDVVLEHEDYVRAEEEEEAPLD